MAHETKCLRTLEVFSTGQAARACRCSVRTVSKWVDAGILKGYRIPGASGDRRIPRPQLIEFLQQHGMPTDLIDPVEPASNDAA